MDGPRILITGASGMIGAAVARRACALGYRVRALVREGSDRTLLAGLDVEYAVGDLARRESLPPAVAGVELVVHCAAEIGDWGPAEKFRALNVAGLEQLVEAATAAGSLRRFIHVSTLGVYPARHHHGTDEGTPADLRGLDGYTLTKAEGEALLQRYVGERGFPAVILRPGFVYGVGDRHVVPRLIRRFEAGTVKLIGSGEALLNNTYVGNFAEAVFLAIDKARPGEVFNIRDARLVTRREYLGAVAAYLGKPMPRRVPLWLARAAVPWIEGMAKLRRRTEPPLLTRAMLKFMTLNLDFSIVKAQRELGYQPCVDFQQGIREALDWATGRAATPNTGLRCGSPS